DELTGGALVDIWRQVGRLHAAGIAHRTLGLARFTMTDAGAVLGGFDDAQVAGSRRDLARDTAQMLVATAVVVGVDPAVDAAVAAVGPAEVGGGLPSLQPLSLALAARRPPGPGPGGDGDLGRAAGPAGAGTAPDGAVGGGHGGRLLLPAAPAHPRGTAGGGAGPGRRGG